MTHVFLSPFLVESVVKSALQEDLGRLGDITSSALVPSDRVWQAVLVARQDGVVAGLDIAAQVFRMLDPSVTFRAACADGEIATTGDVLARLSGLALPMMMAERTALNFLSHMSGIATLTHRYVKELRPYPTQICCTRKTLPGLRAFEKYAVRAGGGSNHRFGLDDAVLIKDNHIAIVGDIREAIAKARAAVGHMVKIEVEVESLDQLEKVLDSKIDAVLLDNMPPSILAQAVQLVGGRFLTEASGGISLDGVNKVAATGVDMISIGALTHSAAHMDIALDEA